MTLERAVRALAGSFVLVSLALGWWVHQGFFLFTAFVGANLLQSAFTGICPAEGLLRRLGVGGGGCCAPPAAGARDRAGAKEATKIYVLDGEDVA